MRIEVAFLSRGPIGGAIMGMSLRDFGGSVVVEVRSNCDQRAVEAVGGRDKVLSSTLLPEAI